MLKLLKYDMRRNRDQFLGLFVVMVLLQLGIAISAEVSNWGYETMFILNLATYIITGVILLVQACRVYDYNLMAYHRRLIPLSAVYTALSPLFMYLLLLVVVSVIAAIHLGIYTLLELRSIPNNTWAIMTTGVGQMLWSACFLMIILLLSVTIARSVRIKGRVWIGIVSFIIIQNGFSWVERLIFGSNLMDNAFHFEITENNAFQGSGLDISRDYYTMWPIVFEMGISVLLVFGITELIKRRIES